jgi:SPP1 gp7 family putative phage head morphogenesis protein
MVFKKLTFDALKKNVSKFQPNRSAEADFYRALKKVAQAASGIVDAHIHGPDIKNEAAMNRQLKAYSEALGPWAERQSRKLLESVNRKNKQAYAKNSKALADGLKSALVETDVGKHAQRLMLEQVALIKSLPLDAGIRAQELAAQSLLSGGRADEIAKQLQATGGVTQNRAKLIAITETARANAVITEARATAVGATHYIWRTTMDGAERDSHAKMNGKVIAYDKKPTLSDGTVGHAGTFPRCRCFQDPIFDD